MTSKPTCGTAKSMLFEEDVRLARGVAAREKKAWETFLTRFGGYLLNYARRHVSSDQMLQEDFVQEFLLKLLKNNSLAHYEGRAPLGSWLRAVLYRDRVDHFRRRKKLAGTQLVESIEIDALGARDGRRVIPGSDGHDILVDGASLNEIRIAIENLAIGDRVALKADLLRHLDIVLTGEEIRFIIESCGLDESATRESLRRVTSESGRKHLAALFGLTESAMNQRIHRARERLKEVLGMHFRRKGRMMSREDASERHEHVRKP
jgi:RNA polymerase sigma factor (sigma-70 family)